MSRKELLDEIERLRSKMNSLAAARADLSEVLEISQRLDELIVLFYKTAGRHNEAQFSGEAFLRCERL